MRLFCIGDVHGKTKTYQKMLEHQFQNRDTFQLGDMGLGFRNTEGLHARIMAQGNHRFIRGNHDNPAKCRLAPGYAGDYGYDEKMGLFWMGGAFSIDFRMRLAGTSWWEDEELSYMELQEAIDLYTAKKPRWVVTHEAPAKAGEYMLTVVLPNFRSYKQACFASRTAGALQTMLEIHQPEEWVFGHYHVTKSFNLPGVGTKFTCVNELAVYILSDEPLVVEA
jgi:hypothetical protein